MRLAPAALLRGELRGRRLLIEDATIDLNTREAVANGTGPVEPGKANAGVYRRLLSASAELLAEQPELQELALHRVVLNDRDDSSGQPSQVNSMRSALIPDPGKRLN